MNPTGKNKTEVVLILGADTPNGDYIAMEAAGKKANLILAGRNLENLHKTSCKCRPLIKGVLFIPADVREKEELRFVVEKTRAIYGRIDSVYNMNGTNQGIFREASCSDQWINANPFANYFKAKIEAIKDTDEPLTTLIVNADCAHGERIAELFGKIKGNLVLVGKNAEHIMETVNRIVRYAKKPHIIVSDMDNENELHECIQDTIKKYQNCDIAINADALNQFSIKDLNYMSLPPCVMIFRDDDNISEPMTQEVREKYKKFLLL